ncbi:MAG TPA: CobD/CbiB family cobalamin biosynthesis protein, partial [Acidimicrobiia bacterium]|nr:CobD/CbiB family cobalamin biosynthesis protein [Acidimicrobiia bacterium]
GTVMTRVERSIYRDERMAGVAYAAIGTAIGAGAGLVLRRRGAAVALAAAGRELRRASARVRDSLLRDDLDDARMNVSALVGRDPSDLDASGLSAAVIESLAENSVDAVVAPTLWALVAGAPGALGYRAVNTMDAMVGHHSPRYEHFGWAAARLDDVANYVPARTTALLVAAVRPRRAPEVWRAVRTQGVAHPSPNAGVAEASFAAALGCELGGPLRYGDRPEVRPKMGFGPRPQPADITRAITLANHVELALLTGVAGAELLRFSAARRRRT